MEISFTDRVTCPDEIIFREIDDEAVLLNLTTEQYYGLDAVGTRMWMELTAASAIEDAFNTLLDVYDVDPGTLRKDMRALIGELVDEGLLKLGDG